MTFERFAENKFLTDFDSIELKEMGSVELMNRVDTKFVMARGVLHSILPDLAKGYRALEVEGNRMSGYCTQYFDSPNYNFYLAHHNGKGNRFKVRIRNYIDSKIYFLEVKNKFKGRTKKNRIKVEDFEAEMSKESANYVNDSIGKEVKLESKLFNTFDRITLVNKVEKERLTIDLNLAFKTKERTANYNHLVIAELKQERIDRESLFYRLMKKNNVRQNSFSKYCVGAISVDDELKYNRFKTNLRLIDKLK
jgi:VTC domain